jgi:hypothetical protein
MDGGVDNGLELAQVHHGSLRGWLLDWGLLEDRSGQGRSSHGWTGPRRVDIRGLLDGRSLSLWNWRVHDCEIREGACR